MKNRRRIQRRNNGFHLGVPVSIEFERKLVRDGKIMFSGARVPLCVFKFSSRTTSARELNRQLRGSVKSSGLCQCRIKVMPLLFFPCISAGLLMRNPVMTHIFSVALEYSIDNSQLIIEELCSDVILVAGLECELSIPGEKRNRSSRPVVLRTKPFLRTSGIFRLRDNLTCLCIETGFTE